MDNSSFTAEKLSLKTFRINSWQLNIPEGFQYGLVEGHVMNTSFRTGFNVKNQTAKADIKVEVITKSREEQEEAVAEFNFSFFYDMANFSDLVDQEESGELTVDSVLLNSLAGITYSTTRGILITRLQGTPFGSFIMPVISPNKLLEEETPDW